MSRIVEDRPRTHHYRFAHVSLRRIVTQDPLRFAEAARRDDFSDLLFGLWGALGDTLPPEERVSPEGMECRRCEIAAHAVVVVKLPRPEHGAEAYFVAAAVAPGGGVRYFALEHAWDLDGSALTVLSEWVSGNHINIGAGPAPEEADFLVAVEGRLG